MARATGYESVPSQIRYLVRHTKRQPDQAFHRALVVTSLYGFSLNRVLSASRATKGLSQI